MKVTKNDSKKKVAVISPTYTEYIDWVKNNSDDDIDYIHVKKIEDVKGHRFIGAERTINWLRVENVVELLSEVQVRLSL